MWVAEPSTEFVTRMVDEEVNRALAELDPPPPPEHGNKLKRQVLLVYRAIRLIMGSKLSHAKVTHPSP